MLVAFMKMLHFGGKISIDKSGPPRHTFLGCSQYYAYTDTDRGRQSKISHCGQTEMFTTISYALVEVDATAISTEKAGPPR